MKKGLSLAELLKNSDRLYLGRPDVDTPLVKWEPEALRHVALLFRFKHYVDSRADQMEYIVGLREFVEAFNNYCGVPIELDAEEAFGDWPADPFEDWLGKTHTRYILNAHVFQDGPGHRYCIAIDISGVIDMDCADYEEQYAQAIMMRKMAK